MSFNRLWLNVGVAFSQIMQGLDPLSWTVFAFLQLIGCAAPNLSKLGAYMNGKAPLNIKEVPLALPSHATLKVQC